MMTASVDFFMGIASIYFVKYYVAVSIHLCYMEDGGFISPMKYRPHCMKGSSTEIDFSSRGCSFPLLSKI
jgi:hypothetical protein